MNLLFRGGTPPSPGRRPAIVLAPAHLARLFRAGFVFAREGVFGLVDPVFFPWPIGLVLRLGRLIERRTAVSGAAGTAGAVRLAAALTRLGPSYVKLGQFLATRPDIVGAALLRGLQSLPDRMAPCPQAEAEAAVSSALGAPIGGVFASFGPPVAAASIAQVHRAEVLDQGERRPVAVKVLRPGIERRFKIDLEAFAFVAM